MKLLLALAVWLCLAMPSEAAPKHFWRITSPDHGQTFAYGSEERRVWSQWGRDNHLALLLTYSNEPYVDRDNPKQTDFFIFHFRNILLGKDGHTFYYKTRDGRSIPVARKKAGFLGIDQIKLLPNAVVLVEKLHGYVSVVIILEDRLYDNESLLESL